MSTSLLYHGWGLKGYRHVRSHYGGGKLIFTVQPNARSLTYPVCHGRDILHHGSIYRMWREVSIWPQSRYSSKWASRASNAVSARRSVKPRWVLPISGAPTPGALNAMRWSCLGI